MGRKITTEIFIKRAKALHGDKYDYSKVVYKKAKEKVEIICPKHGSFMQDPHHHIDGKNGCPLCGEDRTKIPICGVGINDVKGVNDTTLYNIWEKMIMRCYSNDKKVQPRKDDKRAFLCEDWKLLSKFKEWFDENYVEGYQLDKDILSNGAKIYSPETCCFVPPFINSLLVKNDADRGLFPIGVSLDKKNNKFVAQMTKRGKHLRIGWFESPFEAFMAYKREKEAFVKDVAMSYFKEGKIKQNVYEALMSYEVSITD